MRLNDSLTGSAEQAFITLYQDFFRLYHSNEQVIIYGTGKNARQVFSYLQQSKLQVVGFCDSTAIDGQRQLSGLPVLSAQTATQQNCMILIASSWHFEIAEQLRQLGFNRFMNVSLLAVARFAPIPNIQDKIDWLCSVLDPASRSVLSEVCEAICSDQNYRFSLSNYPQYRHPDFSLSEQAVIVDAGACCGEIFRTFADQLPQKTFVCFEPDPKNAQHLRQHQHILAPDATVYVEEKGLWSNNCTLRFMAADVSGASFNCSISDEGNVEIQTCALDSYLTERQLAPDLIKMDIEGAEYEALEGARQMIQQSSPLLAICTYHYLDDLWLLAEWIARVDSGYRFSLGHHTSSWFETVLYAKVQRS